MGNVVDAVNWKMGWNNWRNVITGIGQHTKGISHTDLHMTSVVTAGKSCFRAIQDALRPCENKGDCATNGIYFVLFFWKKEGM